MIIQVNEDWRIVSEAVQWIIQRRKPTKAGDTWRSVGYHRNLDCCLIALAGRQVRALDGEYPSEAVATLCKALDRIERDIREALAGFKTDAAAYQGEKAQE